MNIEFKPNPGDIIICHNMSRWLCVDAKNYPNIDSYRDSAIYAVSVDNKTDRISWARHDGRSKSAEYNIIKVEPKKI